MERYFSSIVAGLFLLSTCAWALPPGTRLVAPPESLAVGVDHEFELEAPAETKKKKRFGEEEEETMSEPEPARPLVRVTSAGTFYLTGNSNRKGDVGEPEYLFGNLIFNYGKGSRMREKLQTHVRLPWSRVRYLMRLGLHTGFEKIKLSVDIGGRRWVEGTFDGLRLRFRGGDLRAAGHPVVALSVKVMELARSEDKKFLPFEKDVTVEVPLDEAPERVIPHGADFSTLPRRGADQRFVVEFNGSAIPVVAMSFHRDRATVVTRRELGADVTGEDGKWRAKFDIFILPTSLLRKVAQEDLEAAVQGTREWAAKDYSAALGAYFLQTWALEDEAGPLAGRGDIFQSNFKSLQDSLGEAGIIESAEAAKGLVGCAKRVEDLGT